MTKIFAAFITGGAILGSIAVIFCLALGFLFTGEFSAVEWPSEGKVLASMVIFMGAVAGGVIGVENME